LRDPDADEFSRQARYRRRNAIPERIWNAFLDGQVLYNELSADRRREIFNGWEDFAEPVEADNDESDRPDHFAPVAESRGQWLEKVAADRGLTGWLGFLYLGMTESDYVFSDLLRTAVTRAERSRGRKVTAFDLTIETDTKTSLDELRARFADRADLTTAEINRLREAGEVGKEELADYYDEYTEFTTEKV
jgi:hypothetical protein